MIFEILVEPLVGMIDIGFAWAMLEDSLQEVSRERTTTGGANFDSR